MKTFTSGNKKTLNLDSTVVRYAALNGLLAEMEKLSAFIGACAYLDERKIGDSFDNIRAHACLEYLELLNVVEEVFA